MTLSQDWAFHPETWNSRLYIHRRSCNAAKPLQALNLAHGHLHAIQLLVTGVAAAQCNKVQTYEGMLALTFGMLQRSRMD